MLQIKKCAEIIMTDVLRGYYNVFFNLLGTNF
jgi:hypothetical protein